MGQVKIPQEKKQMFAAVYIESDALFKAVYFCGFMFRFKNQPRLLWKCGLFFDSSKSPP